MSTVDYPNNSYKHREKMKEQEKEKQIAKVASGKIKKKSEVRKLADVFVAEDISDVKSYVLMDILVPAVKKAISDIVTNGVDMILYGETGRTKKRSGSDYVPYRSYSDRRDDRRDRGSRPNSRFDLDDIIFDTRGKAEKVLDQMLDILDRYGIVSVAELYEMADLSAPPYTSNRYGWTNLSRAYVDRTRDGYVIKLPRAMVID